MRRASGTGLSCLTGRACEPGARRLDQRVAGALVPDLLDRLGDEGLDQQRLGLALGDAAGHQVELQGVVERARRRAVAALHVVGENLELRLVVGLGVLGEQQRARHHAGIGLLGAVADDDLALEHAAARIVEHGLEDLAAAAMAGGVIDQHGGVGVLARLEEARAVDRKLGPGAVAAHEQLVAHDVAAGDEAHVGKPRIGADGRAQRREVQRIAALGADLDVIERGAARRDRDRARH